VNRYSTSLQVRNRRFREASGLRVHAPSLHRARVIAALSERWLSGSTGRQGAIPSARLPSSGVQPTSVLQTRGPGDWPTNRSLLLHSRTSACQSVFVSCDFTPLAPAGPDSPSFGPHSGETQSERWRNK
jgi:hypothetical protein